MSRVRTSVHATDLPGGWLEHDAAQCICCGVPTHKIRLIATSHIVREVNIPHWSECEVLNVLREQAPQRIDETWWKVED